MTARGQSANDFTINDDSDDGRDDGRDDAAITRAHSLALSPPSARDATAARRRTDDALRRGLCERVDYDRSRALRIDCHARPDGHGHGIAGRCAVRAIGVRRGPRLRRSAPAFAMEGEATPPLPR